MPGSACYATNNFAVTAACRIRVWKIGTAETRAGACYFIRLSTKSPTTINPFWYGDSLIWDASRSASMQCLRARKRVCSSPCDWCTSSYARSTSPGSRKRRSIIGFSSGN
uniref:Uncharacterized protein n=1 Tax=Anopheles maculatus TaxID=74869 RepID=A0A182SSS5_9DIPT